MALKVQSKFRGLNKYTAAGDLQPGELTAGDNVFVDSASGYQTIVGPQGVQGGDLVTRQALVSLLTSPLGGKLVSPLPFLQSDGTTAIIMGAAGGSPTTGTIRQWVKGAAATTDVPVSGGASFALNTSGIRIARQGKYAYIIDGSANGNLYRTDLTAEGSGAVIGLNPPTFAPSVSLTDLPITQIPVGSTSGWKGDTLASYTSGATLIPNGQTDLNNVNSDITNPSGASVSPDVINNCGANNNIGSTWQVFGANVSVHPANGQYSMPSAYHTVAPEWLALDDPGAGLATHLYQASPSYNALQSPALAAPNAADSCVQFYYSFNWYTSDTRSLQGIKVIAQAYNIAQPTSATTPIGVQSASHILPFAGQSPGQQIDGILAFPGLQSQIKAVRLLVVGGDSNINASRFDNWKGFPCCANIVFAPVDNGITLTEQPGGAGFQINHAEPTSAYYGSLAGVRLTFDAGAGNPQDTSGSDVLTLNLAQAPGGMSLADLTTDGLAFQVGFRQDGSAQHYLSNIFTIADTDTDTFASVDVSTIPTDIRAAWRYFEIVPAANLTVTESTAALIVLQSLSAAGNLSITDGVGTSYAPVFYCITEVDANGDETLVNIIESDGSPTSASLSAALNKAIGQLVLNAPVNTETTHFRAYRFGGVFVDGYGRLVATVPIAANVALGADANTCDQSNPYISWDFASRTLLDNTPDSFLFNAAVFEVGRNSPPLSAQAIAATNGRIALACGSTVAFSWLVQAGIEDGIYFTSANIPTDPEIDIKGATFSLGASDNDPIVQLVPFGTSLIAFKRYSVWLIQGTNPNDYQVTQLLANSGIGMIAPMAWAIIDNTVWFLGSDGLYALDGNTADPVGIKIEKMLDARALGISPAAMAQAAMVHWDRRLYLLAPATSADTGNTVAYVYDTRTQSYTRYTGFAFTGGCSLTGDTDTNDVFFTGYDGNIHTFGGPVDNFTFTTRGIGQEEDDTSAFDDTRPTRYYISGTAYGTTAITVTVTGDVPSAAFTKTHTVTVPAGQASTQFEFESSVARRAHGALVYVTISGTGLTSPVRIHKVALNVAEGATQR